MTRGLKPAWLVKTLGDVDEAHASMHRQQKNMREAHRLIDSVFQDGRIDETDRATIHRLHALVLSEQRENLSTDVRLEEACVCLADL
jgi:hypothetical protein